MKENKFGIEKQRTEKFNWPRSNRRMLSDTRSDFIYAPHLRYIYARAGDELAARLKAELNAGTYSPGVPIHIEVPKSTRMRTAKSNRSSLSFSRQGSILLPKDRLFFQILADEMAPIVGAVVDEQRSFSHRLGPPDSDALFLSTRECWSGYQAALQAAREKPNNRYVIKVDISNYFGSINQHTLVNRLKDAGLENLVAERLEALLVAFTGDRSSRSILQGIMPTDLLGEFYLTPTDRHLKDLSVDSIRYVDDFYIFVKTSEHAERLMMEFIPHLRSYDLSVNESKSVFMPSQLLLTEEPDLESLFQDAIQELSEQLEDFDFSVEYGFQSDWDEPCEDREVEDESLELAATIRLFDSIGRYEVQTENIERFCLPLFSKAGSDHAIEHVIGVFDDRPAMAQIYCSYLANFISQPRVKAFLGGALEDASSGDWQRMWIGAALLSLEGAGDDIVSRAAAILRDAQRHEALRAVAAIIVGRFGDADRRKWLFTFYPNVGSSYVQLAIYFSSKDWVGVERRNAEAAWSEHGDLNRLLAKAMAAK